MEWYLGVVGRGGFGWEALVGWVHCMGMLLTVAEAGCVAPAVAHWSWGCCERWHGHVSCYSFVFCFICCVCHLLGSLTGVHRLYLYIVLCSAP